MASEKVTRWFASMPNVLSVPLLLGAIASAVAVHDELHELRTENRARQLDIAALRSDVAEIKRAVVGTLARR